MVSAIINIDKKTNRILNMVKAKYDLKTKSEAIDMMAIEYEKELMPLEIRPEYAKKLEKIRKQRGKIFSNVDDMIKEIEEE
jgi:hypothetical protein